MAALLAAAQGKTSVNLAAPTLAVAAETWSVRDGDQPGAAGQVVSRTEAVIDAAGRECRRIQHHGTPDDRGLLLDRRTVGGAVTEKLDLAPWTPSGGPAEGLAEGRPVTTVDFDLSDGAHSHPVTLEFAQPGPDEIEGLLAGAVGQLVPPSGDGDAGRRSTAVRRVHHRGPALALRVQRPERQAAAVVRGRRRSARPDHVQGEHAVLGVGVQATHPLGNAHLWAHVQRPRGGAVGSGLSRVLSLAPLDPATDYTAALVVPWVNGGAAWTGGAPVTVRCLRSWHFRTGEAGTFETLAAELHPADNDPIGTVTVTLPSGETVRVPGALTSIEFEIEPLGDRPGPRP